VRRGRRPRDGYGSGRRVGERRRRERGLHERGRLDGTTTVHGRRCASHRASGSGEGDGRPGTHRGRRGRTERPGVVGIVHLRLRELRLRHVATHVSGRRARMSPARSKSSAQTNNRRSATCFFETAVFFDDAPPPRDAKRHPRRVHSRASSSPTTPPFLPSSPCHATRLPSSAARTMSDMASNPPSFRTSGNRSALSAYARNATTIASCCASSPVTCHNLCRHMPRFRW
jgi:hypothetical protein